MDLYEKTAYKLSRNLTLAYSTSFSMSSRLFSAETARHIYAVYGLVRTADEIVDTYKGKDAPELLNQLQAESYAAIARGYSSNPIIHAFALTAHKFSFEPELLQAFFASMRLDLTPQTFTQKLYDSYIHGSAEVVGLMCLRVFVAGDIALYEKLKSGAMHLGAGYQKVNFLRDLSSDHTELDRLYFPGYTFESFDEGAKMQVVADISHDFDEARKALSGLPKDARLAVSLSIEYYTRLLRQLSNTPIERVKTQRVRVSNGVKIFLLCGVRLGLIT